MREPHHNEARTKTILIVEDDPRLGDLLAQVIRLQTPYQPVLVTNAEQALTHIEQRLPALILLDYILSDMDGITLYDHLCSLQSCKDLPVLLMSARPPLAELASRQLPSLQKPFRLSELIATIETLLKKA